jgi:hypothetical protein
MEQNKYIHTDRKFVSDRIDDRSGSDRIDDRDDRSADF